MKMVKLIIDIPKEDYDIIKNDGMYSTFSAEMKRWGLKAIRNGKLIEDKTCNYGNMTLPEFIDEQYKNREDKDNMFGIGISDEEFREIIIDYFLGEDWYVVDPLGQTQVNEIALYKILEKYSKRYRKECKKRKSRK